MLAIYNYHFPDAHLNTVDSWIVCVLCISWHISEKIMVYLFFWNGSLISIMIPRWIHFVTNGKISFFVMAE